MARDWFADATAATATGSHARSVDWSATPLGDPAGWPDGLRAAATLCFTTRFPVMIMWGPALTMIYNDGYAEMLGPTKHPDAMGAPGAQVWAEIWDDIHPLIDQVMTSGAPIWRVDEVLYIERDGQLEETAFTFSYSPLVDDDGTVRGILDIATETTLQVVDRRRLTTLGRLTTNLHETGDQVDELAHATITALAGSIDVPRADLYLEDGGTSVLVASTSTSRSGGAAVPQTVLHDVVTRRRATTVGRTVVAPLGGRRGSRVVGVLALEASPHRPFDDANRAFLELLASAVGTALVGTLDHLREVGELRTVSDALQSAMRPDAPVTPGWQTRYRPADGRLAIGGDWYDVVDLEDGRTGFVVGDCVGHGLAAAAAMGQLRSASRALMLDGAAPAEVLDGLDRFARTLPGAEFATVLCGVVDARDGSLAYASAGHPSGLVVRLDGSSARLDDESGPPLTLARADRRGGSTSLRSGDTLVLCTDGLVERRSESLAVGIDRLRRVSAELLRTTAVNDVPDALIAALLPDGARDDVALVTYHHGATVVRPARDPGQGDSELAA